MKQMIAMALFALASLVTVDSAMAQNYRVKANIPFNFMVGSTRLPAGTYTFSSQDRIALQIQNGSEQATVLSGVAADDKGSDNVKLIFTLYGDQYFLSKILCPNPMLNLKLPVSKLEKKLERERLQGHGQVNLLPNS